MPKKTYPSSEVSLPYPENRESGRRTAYTVFEPEQLN